MKSKIIAFVSIILLALVFAIPALAGGWATITLEELPTGVTAGEPLSVRFTVRQHGKTLMTDLTPKVTAQNMASGEAISAEATPVEGKDGLYEATLTLPTPGNWEWHILAFTMVQRMPDLAVSASAPIEPVAVQQGWAVPPLAAGIAALMVVLAAMALVLLKRPRWALGLMILGVLVGGAGFASASSKVSKPEMPTPANQVISAVKTGEELFVSKGCVTCHVNSRIDDKYYSRLGEEDFYFLPEFGPNLSKYAASPEFLRIWLKDPSATRPSTEMPNLELDEAEIEALVSYLSANPAQSKAPETPKPIAEQVVTATPRPKQVEAPAQKTTAGEDASCSNLDRSRSLLVSYSRDAGGYLSLVDPSTGIPLCHVEPLELGTSASYAYSPDRSALAALSAETPAQRKWHLHWIDLKNWKVTDTGLVLDSWTQGMAVNPARTHIAIANARLTKDYEQRILGFNLTQVDLSAKGEFINIELDVSPRLVAYSKDGQSLLVYGAAYDIIKGTSASPAIVRLYSASDLSLIWEAELDDVLEGVFKTGEDERNDPDQFTQWQPALALSPDLEKLYVVHADADRLTTVDLLSRRIETTDIQPRMSWLERLLRLTSSVAHAKVLNGTTKQAALSPDGTRLYVSGFTGLPSKDQQGNWQFDILPLGLQVIDTSNGSEIRRIENEASEISLSADGTMLFLRGWANDQSWTDILDAESLETASHLDRQLLYPAQSLSGENLVVGSPEGQWTRMLEVFDARKFSPVSRLPGNGYWISTP